MLRQLTSMFSLWGLSICLIFGQVNPNHHTVRGYYRKDGTYVRSHQRTNPNSTNRDNYSTQGNTNPWTGEAGTVPRDNNPNPSYSYPTTTSSSRNSYPSSYSGSRSSSQRYYTPTPDYEMNWDLADLRYYDLSAGEVNITYKNGVEKFTVLADTQTRFSRAKEYTSYHPIADRIYDLKGRSNGQLLNGPYKFYSPSGVLLVSGQYQRGLKEGVFQIFNEEAELEQKITYDRGEIVQVEFFYEEDVRIVQKGPDEEPGTKLEIWNGTRLKKEIIYQAEGYRKEIKYGEDTRLIEQWYTMKGEILNGPFKIFHSDGISLAQEGSFENSYLDGELTNFYPTGRIESKYNYRSGKKHGPYSKWSEIGILREEGQFAYDSLEGEIISYNKYGDLDFKMNYLGGVLHGPFFSYYREKVYEKGVYRLGHKDGLWERFVISPDQEYRMVEYFSYEKDILNGPFQEIKNDSVICGKYRNGLLEGKYLVYQPLEMLLLGSLPSDLTPKDQIILEGSYSKGEKTGYWREKYPFIYSPKNQGYFLADQEQGVWSYFLMDFEEGDSSATPYAGECFMKVTFEKGVLEGKTERYFSQEEIVIPCSSSAQSLKSDTCLKLMYHPIYEVTNYKDGKKHGRYLQKDSLGEIIHQGQYLNDNKEGTWRHVETDDGELEYWSETYKAGALWGPFEIRDTNGLLKLKGSFTQDQPSGIWSFFRNGHLWKKTEYGSDFRKESHYNSQQKRVGDYLWEKDDLTRIVLFDTLKNDTQRVYNNISFTNGNYKFEELKFSSDTLTTTNFIWQTTTSERVNDPNLWRISFKLLTGRKSLIEDGPFKMVVNGHKVVEGKFQQGIKVGEWTYQYPSEDLQQRLFYLNEELVSEQFWSISMEQPIEKGTISLIDWWGVDQKVKIKNGLRHGKTVILDSETNEKTKFRYQRGILVE